MPQSQTSAAIRAREILKNPKDPAITFTELLEVSGALERGNKLEYARRLLELATDRFFDSLKDEPEKQLKLVRKLALDTYKDPDLPADVRLRSAEAMLNTVLAEAPPTTGEDLRDPRFAELAPRLRTMPELQGLRQDLLGIAGAVQKRRWDIYGARRHLIRACNYYRRGYEMGAEADSGYTGINFAFVLDLLSEQDEAEFREVRRKMADDVRSHVAGIVRDKLAGVQDVNERWWMLCTLGEARLGLAQYEEAAYWLRQAAQLKASLDTQPDATRRVAPWQFEAAARQISQLARLRARRDGIPAGQILQSKPWSVVAALLGDDSTAASSFLRGKVGLALSGGGFRASLFHIGVLARLAELDVLRHVEVLSCVSGGSILGAHYYLELRNLLQTRIDQEITRECYIELVKRVRQKFLQGVQRNIRVRMLFGPGSNLRVFTRKCSTSDRLAALYEKELYGRIDDGEQSRPRFLADLTIAPLVETTNSSGGGQGYQRDQGFNPKYGNWRRCNKVPMLVLNATTLNTCHNWQFTASFMGEPPARAIDAEINSNNRMRRMYHDEAPGAYRRVAGQQGNQGVRLGEAVAASACVPGLFDPLVLEDLYGETGRVTTDYVTRLVDGGNYDNQGITGLREQDCSILLVSDASGQTGISDDPSGGHVDVIGRANNILMARVREAQYQWLATLQEAGSVQGLLYLHLKKDLAAATIDWLHCDDRSDCKPEELKTGYGIRRDLQKRLAAIRTDLDSFSWLEADALMLSGYRMADSEWNQCLRDFPVSTAPATDWEFQKLEPVLAANNTPQGAPPAVQRADKGLGVAANITFKPMRLSRPLLVGFLAPALVPLGAAAWLVHWCWSKPIPQIGFWTTVIVAVILALVGIKELVLKKLLHWRAGYTDILLALLCCSVGWLLLYPYLWLIDTFYINWGSEYRKSIAPRSNDAKCPPPRTAAA